MPAVAGFGAAAYFRCDDADHLPQQPRHVSHFDPSWCARINAHRRPPAAGAPAAAPEPVPPPEPAAPPPFKVREIPREHVCEMCGTVMYDHNCKIVCPNCGYKRDCSDP